MTMTHRERFFNALNGKAVDRVPIFCANQTATYEQMEKLKAFWPDANYKAEPMAVLAAGASSVLGFDAVRVPFCQTVEAEALGCTLKEGGDKGLPSIDVNPYKIGEVIDFPEDYIDRGRIKEVGKAVAMAKEIVGEDVPVLGGVIGPLSIATSLIGLMDILMGAFQNPETVIPWLDIAERAATEYAQVLIDAGADGIVIEDMMASMDLISPQMYSDLAGPWQKKLIDNISVPTILHICGKVNPLAEDMIKTGTNGFSVDIMVDAMDLREKINASGETIAVIGGLDAVNTLFYGDDLEVVKAEVKKASESGYDMIAPSCSIPPAAPDEKLLAAVEAAQELAMELV